MVSLDREREGMGLQSGYGWILIKVLTCLDYGFVCVSDIVKHERLM